MRDAGDRCNHRGGKCRRFVQGCLEPMFLANVGQKLMANGPTHPVEDDQQHSVAGSGNLGDELRQHVLHAANVLERRASRCPVGQRLGERLVELLPSSQNRLIKLLVGFGQVGDILAPADRFPCPIDKGQFLPVDVRHLGKRRCRWHRERQATAKVAEPFPCEKAALLVVQSWLAGERQSRTATLRIAESIPELDRRVWR